MKILFLAHRIPYPPDKGERIRAWHELQFLAARHTVDLFAFADPPEQRAGRAALQAICRRVHLQPLSRAAAMLRAAASLLTAQPFSTAYFHSASMAQAVRESLAGERYDAIFVYCSAMAPYVSGAADIPVILDFVDSDAAKWAQYARYAAFPKSWLYAREAKKLCRFEREAARAARVSLVTTPLEVEAIDPAGELGVQVMQNGVAMPAPGETTEMPSAFTKKYVVFIGQMDYLPNVDAVCYFTREIFPLIQQKHPELEFLIVGRNPAPRVRDLASRPGVRVTGGVPNVRPYLENALAAVAPLRICQGVQNKILEALALGVPVVSTSRPARAVGAIPGKMLLVADTPAEFAHAVVSLAEQPELRAKLGAAQEFIRQRFDWQKNLQPLETWLQQWNRAPAESPAIPARNYVAAH